MYFRCAGHPDVPDHVLCDHAGLLLRRVLHVQLPDGRDRLQHRRGLHLLLLGPTPGALLEKRLNVAGKLRYYMN